jgi:hypothetical protein
LAALALGAAAVGVVALSITPHERLTLMMERLKNILGPAEHNSVETFNNISVPFLNSADPEALFKDAQQINNARQTVAKTREQLRDAEAALQRMDFSDEKWRKARKEGEDYLAAWSRFYDGFGKVLDRRTPWTVAERADLIRTEHEAARLAKQLGVSLQGSP